MTDPTPTRPLWEMMQAAYFQGIKPGFSEPRGYAAEIRAIADWLVPEELEIPPGDLTEQAYRQDERFDIRARLLAEADRSEAGG